jgi:hypothetical protein
VANLEQGQMVGRACRQVQQNRIASNGYVETHPYLESLSFIFFFKTSPDDPSQRYDMILAILWNRAISFAPVKSCRNIIGKSILLVSLMKLITLQLKPVVQIKAGNDEKNYLQIA